MSYTKAAMNRMRSLKGAKQCNAVHAVLAHLCSKLDLDSSVHGDDDSDNGDAEIFESMLVRETPTFTPDNKDLDEVEILTVSTQGFDHSSQNF